MEHYRSTIATTAIAVLGLVAAAHVLYPGNYERADRQTRVVVITREATSAPTIWAGPPRRLHASEPASLMADSSALLAHRLTMSLPSGARMAPRLASTLAAPISPDRKFDGDSIGNLIRGLALDQDS
jgi:hypothetical protein